MEAVPPRIVLYITIIFATLAFAPVAGAVKAKTIDRVLREFESPLAGHGRTFVEEGRKNGIDPLFLVSITGFESTLGRADTCGRKNPFGVGSHATISGPGTRRSEPSRQDCAAGMSRTGSTARGRSETATVAARPGRRASRAGGRSSPTHPCARRGKASSADGPYSHSMVAGGFDEMSSATRFTSGISLMIREETRLEKIVGETSPVGGHRVLRGDRADDDRVRVGAGNRPALLPIESPEARRSSARVRGRDRPGAPPPGGSHPPLETMSSRSRVSVTDDPDRQAGARERLAPDHCLGQTKLRPQPCGPRP